MAREDRPDPHPHPASASAGRRQGAVASCPEALSPCHAMGAVLPTSEVGGLEAAG